MIQRLGKFKPSQLTSAAIATELPIWLSAHGLKPREMQIGVRTPADTANACASTPVLMEWHRDGCPDPTAASVTPSVQQIVVWSNGTPTRLRENGTERHHQPGDVLLFDNTQVWHAAPPPEPNRWFVGIADPLTIE